MKKIRFFALFMLAAISVVLCSCTDDDEDTIKEQVIGTFKASISGEAWSANAPGASMINDTTMVMTGIGFLGDNKKKIVLTFIGNTPGSFTINTNPLNGPVTYNTAIYNANADVSEPSNTYSAYSGEMEITERTETNRVSGSFSFTCANVLLDTMQVTNGQFSNIKIVF